VYPSWWRQGQDWSGVGDDWRDIGGVLPVGAPVSAVSRNPNQMDLFICGDEGHVYTFFIDGQDWSGLGNNWRDIGGIFPVGAPVSAVSRNPNQMDLFIGGDDRNVYTSWWSRGRTGPASRTTGATSVHRRCQIAADLQIPEASVKLRLHDALRALRQMLQETGVTQ
jgi:hypothetical protein